MLAEPDHEAAEDESGTHSAVMRRVEGFVCGTRTTSMVKPSAHCAESTMVASTTTRLPIQSPRTSNTKL